MKARASTDRGAAAAKRSKPARAGSKKTKPDLGVTVRGTPRLIAPGSGRLEKNYIRSPIGMTDEAWKLVDAARGRKYSRGEWLQWVAVGIPPANGAAPPPKPPRWAPRPPAA